MSKKVSRHGIGVVMFAALVLSTSQAVAGDQKEMLKEAYQECDKLLIIPSAGEDLKVLYDSAGKVGECKSQKYREIYVESPGNEIGS